MSGELAVASLRDKGVAAFNRGEYGPARECFRYVLALQPQDAATLANCGFACNRLGLYAEGLDWFERALCIDDDDAEVLNSRGVALAQLGRHGEAVDSFRAALRIDPKYVDALSNLGGVLSALDQHQQALQCCGEALTLDPEHVLALANAGHALNQLNRHSEAIGLLGRALAIQPDRPEVLVNLGIARLAQGDLPGGFSALESRWRTLPLVRHRLQTEAPQWRGDAALRGKRILIHHEQGYGDTIQFARYIPRLVGQAAHVILRVPAPLRSLLVGLPGVDELVDSAGTVPRHDLHCPVMSLPLAFHATLRTIPAEVPYLRADPSRTAFWRALLGPKRKPRVGLLWAGRQYPPVNYARDVSFEMLKPILEFDFEFVSLQKEVPKADASGLAAASHVMRVGEALGDFADTAALIDTLDLVIAVDTAGVHLAGALAKPVWVMNRYASCWRWMRDRTDSPWYPTLRLFRQKSLGDWAGVVNEVVSALAGFADTAVELKTGSELSS